MLRRYLLLVVILGGLILAGCGKQEPGASTGKQAVKNADRVLVVGERDPIRTLDNGFLLVEKAHIAETLLRMGEDYRLEPLLATSWKQVDANTWEFILRDGVKFHDGSALTAAVVVRALD
ncbi:MAG: ABC transporter substrate-binding protein, partial [Bacillota bacterium]